MTASKNINIGPTTQFWMRDKPRTFAIPKHFSKAFILDFGKRRIHHQNQSQRDWDVGGACLKPPNQRRGAGKKVPEANAQNHGQKNPQGKITVEKSESTAIHWRALDRNWRSRLLLRSSDFSISSSFALRLTRGNAIQALIHLCCKRPL